MSQGFSTGSDLSQHGNPTPGESLRELEKKANQLLESDSQNFEFRLKVFIHLCKTDPNIQSIVSGWRKTRPFLHWYKEQARKGRFDLPADKDDVILRRLYDGLECFSEGEVSWISATSDLFGETGPANPKSIINNFAKPVIAGLKEGLEKMGAGEQGYVQAFPSLEYILTEMERRGLKQTVGKELRYALSAFDDGRMGDCCNNLRMGLFTMLSVIYSDKTGDELPVRGKSPDFGKIEGLLHSCGFLQDTVGMISSTWSFVAERAHVEKRKGVPPSENDTRYCIALALGCMEYVLRSFR